MNPYHAGEYLQELLDDYNITAYKLAKDTHMPRTRVSEILKGKRGISIDTAMRLSKYFGNSVQQWLNLQQSYDLYKYHADDINEIKPLGEVA